MTSSRGGADVRTDGAPRVRLELQLIGWWSLRACGRPVPLGRREQKLVALLALSGRRPRSYVAGTLWPETTNERAFTSLRAAILQTQRAVPQLLDVDRVSVGLQPQVHVDVHHVVQCATDVAHGVVADFDRASRTLTSGDLLPGWYEDWVLSEREHLRNLRLQSLEALALRALDARRSDCAVTAAQGAKSIEPLRESAHAIMLRAHLLAGNRSSAIQEFHDYRQRLEEELAIAPAPQLVWLVDSIFRPDDVGLERGKDLAR